MKVYITFGQVHVHSVNGITFDKDCVALIEAEDEFDGRKKAFEYFGDKWFSSCMEEKINTEFLSYFPRGIIPVERTLKEVT